MGKKKIERELIVEAEARGFFDYPHKWDHMAGTRSVCVELKYCKNDGLPYLYDKKSGDIIWWEDAGWATVIKPAKTKGQAIIEEAISRGFVMGAVHTGMHGMERFEITQPLHFAGSYLFGGERGCIFDGTNWAKLVSSEKKKPIFTTEDGVDVFANQEYYMVWECNGWQVSKHSATKLESLSSNTWRFSTDKAALDFIMEQRPKVKPGDEAGIGCANSLSTWIIEELKKPKSLKPEELVEGEIYFAETNDEGYISSIFRHGYMNLNERGFTQSDWSKKSLDQPIRPATLLEKQKLITAEISNNYFHELRNQK